MTKLISRAVFAAAAILIALTMSAMAEDDVVASHTVQFERVSFLCGETNRSGKVVRFIRATPTAKYLPENEPAAADPLAKSWDIVYRNICERGDEPNLTAGLRGKRH
jgi:hypothetical protein